MKAIGRMIYSMVLEKKCGQIILSMRENISKGRSMGKDYIFGQMEASMMVTGLRIGLKVMELTPGSMVDSTLDHGRIIICMVMVSTLGKMEEDMKVIMRWIRNMAMVYINGLMVGNTKAIGEMGSSMAKGSTFYLMEQSEWECGKMARDQNGLMNESYI